MLPRYLRKPRGAPAAPEEGNDDTAETFPRAHVEEAAPRESRYRERAIKAEQLADKHARRLHTELVRATGKLADPTDLPFDEAHLDDPDAFAAGDRGPADPKAAPGDAAGRLVTIGQGRRRIGVGTVQPASAAQRTHLIVTKLSGNGPDAQRLTS